MQVFTGAASVISAFLIFSSGLLFSVFLARVFRVSDKFSVCLYLWHTFFSILYLWYVLSFGGDAAQYYFDAVKGDASASIGTSAISYLVYLLIQAFGVSIIGAFLFFNIIGFVGIVAFYSCLKLAAIDKNSLAKFFSFFLVLNPSVNFWTSAIGKDSIAFMSVGLVLWGSLDLARRYWIVIFGIFSMALVRPHMAGFMIIAFCIFFTFGRDVSIRLRAFMGAISVAALAFMIPFSLRYVGLDQGAGVGGVVEYINQRQQDNLTGGGAIDIASMNPVLKLFTYMFRPLPFEANSVAQMASSIDNLLILCIFGFGLWGLVKGVRFNKYYPFVFIAVYSVISWVMLSFVTANLGISVRQKWMFLPMLAFILISAMPPKKSVSEARYGV